MRGAQFTSWVRNAEDKLMCYSQEALEPETIKG